MDTEGRLNLKLERLLVRVNKEFKRKFKTPKEMMKTLYFEAGLSYEKVALNIGIARDTAYKYAKHLNLERRKKRNNPKKKREILILNKNGAPKNDIPNYVGCSAMWVHVVLKEEKTNKKRNYKNKFDELPEEDKNKTAKEICLILGCSLSWAKFLKTSYNRRKKDELCSNRDSGIHSTETHRSNKTRKWKLNSLTRST